MATAKTLGVGVLGTGWVAGAHVDNFKKVAGTEVVAVCSRREESARKFIADKALQHAAAYTDLKRHDLCDAEINVFCNEKLVQNGVSTREFLTRKLWDVGNSAPYGHRGDLTTITEAILAHGGEGRASRNAFAALTKDARDEVVEFLKSLQILPDGTGTLVVHEAAQGGQARGAR